MEQQPIHLKVLSNILGLLEPLESDSRRRVLDTVLTFFSEEPKRPLASSTWETMGPISIPASNASIPFSDRTDISSKDFLMQKSPKSDVERIACLGFYLTHFRGIGHFKTTDLTSLNTEAAQPKFSNAAQAVANATKYGYLAPAIKGMKQMSAQGEQFVVALPDREAARLAMSNRPKRSRGRTKSSRAAVKRPAVIADMQGTHRKSPIRKV